MSKLQNIVKKKPFQSLLVVVIFLLSFSFAPIARAADVGDFVVEILAWIALRLVELFGVLFTWFVGILIDIVQFNRFIDLSMVQIGWGLTRDLANMFFIVILLIIAFSTILKIQAYHYEKTLVKLLLMAVLINFSKLIAGFLIDFFQVIMLTFVNGFKDAAAGNIAQGFGIYEMLSSAGTGDVGITITLPEKMLAALLAVFMIIVADMIVLIMIAVLLWRIVMLWILVIISPLAYLSYAIMPKYWSQWWSEFFKHLVSGPVIAFFLWLALLTVQQNSLKGQFTVKDKNNQTQKDYSLLGSAFNNESFMNYLVMMALLLGGLAVAQKMAAQSGSAVGAFAQKVQKVGTRAGMLATGVAAVGYGLRKAREKPVDNLKGLATTKPVRNFLGWAGSRRGILGGAMGATGLRRLATVGLAKVEVEKLAREEKQLNFYGKIKDTRVRERVANSKFNTAARRVVSDTSPSFVHGSRGQRVVNDLSQEKINRLSDAELASLGARAVLPENDPDHISVIGTRLGNHLARNTNDRSLYNFGVEQAQVNDLMNAGVDEVTARAAIRRDNIDRLENGLGIDGMVVGQDRNGRDLGLSNFDHNADDFYQGGYGPPRQGEYDHDRILRRNQFRNMYRLASEEDIKRGRGDGNISLNKFSQGNSNALAIDFDKLDKEKLDFLKNFDEAAKIKGVTLDTPDKITKAATQLVAILDDEINKLRSSGGSEQNIKDLEQARDRLKSPEELSNLQLLNSSAHGYGGLSDLKETYIEEKVHGFGVKSESDAKRLTQQIIDNRLYPILQKLATAVASGKDVDTVIAAELADTSSGQVVLKPQLEMKAELKPGEIETESKGKSKSEIAEEPGQIVSSAKLSKPSSAESVKQEEKRKTVSAGGVSLGRVEGVSKETELLKQIRDELRKKK